jgi:hypothetical protein
MNPRTKNGTKTSQTKGVTRIISRGSRAGAASGTGASAGVGFQPAGIRGQNQRHFFLGENRMKKLLITLAMSCAVAMAQTSTDTKATTEHKHHKQTATSESAAKPESDEKAAKEKTVTGCLQKDGENMWLKTGMSRMGMGGKYHVMSGQDLSAHDGHKVKITGTVSKGPLGNDKSVNHLEAKNVEMVSDKCSWTNEGKKEEKATTTKK